jgi:hypothetical protein
MVRLSEINLKLWQESEAESMRYNYCVEPGELCIDIGSYRREWADDMIKRYGCKVECFDALDNRAAWTHDGVLMMGGQYYYTSAFEPEGPQQTYKCVDIAPYLRHEIAVLKMNIEGCEYDLMEYIIQKGLQKNVRNFQIQFHIVDGLEWEERYNWIAERLSETHKITWRFPWLWENWQRIA